jgi:hypothetical protein
MLDGKGCSKGYFDTLSNPWGETPGKILMI